MRTLEVFLRIPFEKADVSVTDGDVTRARVFPIEGMEVEGRAVCSSCTLKDNTPFDPVRCEGVSDEGNAELVIEYPEDREFAQVFASCLIYADNRQR